MSPHTGRWLRAALSILASVLALAPGSIPTAASSAPSGAMPGAGGRICVALEWPDALAVPAPKFVVADDANRVWQVLAPPLINGRAETCAEDLPPSRYLACEVTGAGFRIVPLPAPGQEATATCLALTLATGESARVAFRNETIGPPAGTAPLPGLPNTGGGGMAVRP
jgi:hypothetical protein